MIGNVWVPQKKINLVQSTITRVTASPSAAILQVRAVILQFHDLAIAIVSLLV